jgi:two-component system heavy metal sensor histidine kinase CusS
MVSALVFVVAVGVGLRKIVNFVSDVDDATMLSTKSEFVISLLQQDDSPASLHQIATLQRYPAKLRKRVYVAIFDDKGKLRALNTAMGSLDGFIDQKLMPSLAGKSEQGVQRFEALDGRTFSWRLDRIQAQQSGWYILCAVDHDIEQNLLNVLQHAFMITTTLVIIGSLILSRFVNAAIMQPVRALSQHTSEIGLNTLSVFATESVDKYPPEFKPLVIAFNQMLERLNHSFKRLSAFSSDIAHELRTPINNMLGEMQVVLERPRTTEEYHVVVQSALEEVERLRSIVESLLLLARNEAGQQTKRQEIDLSRELHLIAEFYDALASEHGVTLKVEVTDMLTIRADRTLFQQAIGNLISNAIKHAPINSAVCIFAKNLSAERCLIEVVDQGGGIPEQAIPFIFDRFFRVDTVRDQISGGVGLGLTITKSIIDLYGGTIEVTSNKAAGTIFRMEWPTASQS